MAKRSIEETFQAIKPKWRKGIPNPPAISVGVESTGSGSGGDFSTALSQAGQQIAQLQSAYQQQASLIQANTQAIQSNTSAQGNRSAGSVAGGVASSLFGGFGLGLLSPLISGIASLFGGGSSTPPPLPVYVPPSPVSISDALYPAATSTSASTPAAASSSASNAAPVTVNAASPAATVSQAMAVLPAIVNVAAAMNNLAGGISTVMPQPIYVPPASTGTAGAAASNVPAQSGTAAAPASVSSQPAPAPQVTVNVTAMDSQSFMDHSTDIANAVREAMLNMHPINGVVASL